MNPKLVDLITIKIDQIQDPGLSFYYRAVEKHNLQPILATALSWSNPVREFEKIEYRKMLLSLDGYKVDEVYVNENSSLASKEIRAIIASHAKFLAIRMLKAKFGPDHPNTQDFEKYVLEDPIDTNHM